MARVLDVAGLVVAYDGPTGAVTAVDGVDLTVEPGEVVGLVGESGSGKTTIATTLLGLHGPNVTVAADRLRLDDVDLLGLDDTGWRGVRGSRITLVPQHPMTALSPLHSVGRQLDWYLGADALERHEDDLRAIGLESVLERPGDRPRSFSGGQLQRLVIAIATFDRDPSLLLADEPTSTLDVSVQAAVLDVLAEQRSRLGTAMVLVSHDLAVIAKVCDRAAVMRGGRIVETGSVEQIFEDPTHPYTRALVAAAGPTTVGTARPATVDAVTEELDPDGTPTATASVLTVDDLQQHFAGRRGRRATPTVRAVDGVTLRVGDGDALAIVGASGSGKTTLARAVTGAIVPTGGHISLDGVRLTPRRTLEQRRAIQLVTQNTRAALNPRRSIGHALVQAQRVHDIGDHRTDRQDRAAHTLDLVGLRPEHLDRRPGRLSGGELARAVLARSLLLSPRLLILDEPTASLDAQVKQQVLEVIDELRRTLGLTVVVITHELAVARRVARTTLVMHEGRIVEEGSVEQVLTDPHHDYTRALLASELQLG